MAPRASKKDAYALAPKTLIIDNGGYNIKAGFATETPSTSDCSIIPNCIAQDAKRRLWVGTQLNNCDDYADLAFRRPVQHGNVSSWEAEREIWEQTFFSPTGSLYKCDPHETNLVLAEAPNGLANLQRHCDEIVFEEFEFAAYHRTSGVSLNAYNDIAGAFGDPSRNQGISTPAECVLVVDSGYSHTIVAPIYKGRPIQQAIRRSDLGGKQITNYLKEIISMRQLNVLNETHIVNEIKEAACFVSTDFKSDMEKAQNHSTTGPIVKDYVMPDFTKRYVGELKDHSPADRKQMASYNTVRREDGTAEAVLMLSNERFTPPEILFNPENIGLRQAGLPELILQSLRKVPTGLWPAMLANVYLVGGNAKLKGFKERLFAELRAIAPTECVVRMETATDPIKATWLGGARFATGRELLKETMITRKDYEEMGTSASYWTERYFSGR